MRCSRREALMIGTAAAGALVLGRRALAAAPIRFPEDQLLKTIPSSGERVPAVGLGTGGSFSRASRVFDRYADLYEVLRGFTESGGRVIDAMPPNRTAERVLGQLTDQIGNRDGIFWAAKLSIEGSGGADAGFMQVEESLEDLGHIDLYQIRNLLRWKVQLPVIRDLKQEGRIRYVGLTVSGDSQYEELEEILRTEDLDFVQFDYAVDNRSAERLLLPLARDRGVAVMIHSPFGLGRLFRRVGDRQVPPWAEDFGARTWAQFFLKWILAAEAVTVVVPGTSNPDHLEENMEAGLGRLPDQEERARMVRVVEESPNG